MFFCAQYKNEHSILKKESYGCKNRPWWSKYNSKRVYTLVK